MAEAGCDAATIQAVTDHASLQALEIYIAQVNRRRRAVIAIAAFEGEQNEAKILQTI
jgi:hypothetical protein